MLGSASQALKLGAGLLLTLAIISLCVVVYSASTDPAKSSTSDFNGMASELKDQKYLSYDNTTVSGSQVINAIRRFSSEGKAGNLGVQVVTGQGNSSWYFNSVSENGDSVTTSTSDISKLSDSVSPQYVNPSGTFDSIVVRDSNQVIRAIKFTQQSK
ncbi:hypothetical protein [Viridibacillus arvi]|uniref:hypothetical protein n=1 Tax=Viridibacillus arvi TaxID=263475 RepID=UPI003D2BEFC9